MITPYSSILFFNLTMNEQTTVIKKSSIVLMVGHRFISTK